MHFLIVTPLGIDLATDVLITEIRRILPETRNCIRWTNVNKWLSAFAYQQQAEGVTGYRLFDACQQQSADFMTQLPLQSLNVSLVTWLSCQTTRALLLASGGYEADSLERHWHGAFYRPLLTYLQQYDKILNCHTDQPHTTHKFPLPYMAWSDN